MVGVGFDTEGANSILIKGPKIDRKAELYAVPDDREGWVESLKMLLESYFLGTNPVEFDYSLLRPEGELIKGFGGTASGPKPLQEMHESIRKVLDANLNTLITVTTIVDIMNLIGKCVVAGNVRRTAEIVFGSPDSEEYLDLKNYEVNPHRAEHGWTSNNTVFAKLGMNYAPVAERTRLNGEPGYAWLENMQKYSRMNGAIDNKDIKATGGNPCLEQTLESYEMCCLVETFPDNHDSYEDYQLTLKYAYLYAKTVTLGETHWPETNRVMLRNRRIGCSMSGIAQFIANKGIEQLRTWTERGYMAIQRYDQVYSDWFAIPRSIKTTSIKPSGTVSLLAGATPGVHFPESRFYIRRMRLAKNSSLIKPLKKAGFHMDDCDFLGDPASVAVSVPIDVGESTRTLDDVTMWEQLLLAAFMQEHWADNQVSCTVTFNPTTEGHQIAKALEFFQYKLKGISFLPKVEKGAYPLMPYEKIDEATYNEMSAKLKRPDFSKVTGETADVEKFCNNDVCEIGGH